MISLEALEPKDLDALYQTENDKETWLDGCQTVPMNRYTLMLYIAEAKYDVQQDGQVRLAIKYEDTTVGFIDLTSIDLLNSKAEVGIYILKEYRGRNLAKEALMALSDYCRKIHLHMLYAMVRETNTVAKKLFQSAGYCDCGKIDDWLRTQDGYAACHFYSLILSRR